MAVASFYGLLCFTSTYCLFCIIVFRRSHRALQSSPKVTRFNTQPSSYRIIYIRVPAIHTRVSNTWTVRIIPKKNK
jgi:hypothetical protein